MKKAAKKAMKRLERYIGHDIIRVLPVTRTRCYRNECNNLIKKAMEVECNSVYTSVPLTLMGFTADGKMQVHFPSYTIEGKLLGTQPFELPSCCIDTLWIPYKKALTAKGNPLNKWKGKKIRRIKPIKSMADSDAPFEPWIGTLVSASKHHVILEGGDTVEYKGSYYIDENFKVLDYEYTNPSEWELVEE